MKSRELKHGMHHGMQCVRTRVHFACAFSRCYTFYSGNILVTKIIAKTPKFIFALCALAIGLQVPAHSLTRSIVPAVTPSMSAQISAVKTNNSKKDNRTKSARAVKSSFHQHSEKKIISAKLAKNLNRKNTKKGVIAKAKTVARRKVAVMSKMQRAAIMASFVSGSASTYAPSQLVAAGVFQSCPLRGGIFKRKNMPQTLVIHSTETASIASARQIVRSWNNAGTYHAGTQYIIDRDGTIYQTVDPYYATYHVDSSKTLLGVKNENSIGIETVRTSDQLYTDAQMKSLTRLSYYLKDRFELQQIVGHGQVQPADRSDPVLFDWTAFRQGLSALEEKQLAFKRTAIRKA